MKFCEALTFEPTPAGVLFQGSEWPAEIIVERGLLEYPQGPHVQFGRRGSLAFIARNGSASYRRVEDVVGGWRYVRTDATLQGTMPPAATRPAPAPMPVAARQFHNIKTGSKIEAFQWLPHAVPPVALPDWFVRADFEQNKEGILTIRSRTTVVRCEPSDWVIRLEGQIGRITAAAFPTSYEVDDQAETAA